MKLSGLLAALSLVCLTVGTAFTLEAPCEVTDSLRSLNSTDRITIADFGGQPGNIARVTVHMTNVDSIAAYVLLITYDTLYLTPVRIFDTTWDHSGSIQSIDSTHILTEPLGRSLEVMAAGGRQPCSWLSWTRPGVISCQFMPGGPGGVIKALPAGSGEVLGVQFLVDASLPHGARLAFDFYQQDYTIIDSSVTPPDTLLALCVGSEVAQAADVALEIYPQLIGGEMVADTGITCCTGSTVGNIDGSSDGTVTMGDLVVLIDHLFVGLGPLTCPDEANTDASADGLATASDLTVLIHHLFISYTPLPPCPF